MGSAGIIHAVCLTIAEKQTFFVAGETRIEGLISLCPGEKGVVVSHPHPLYGGNMYNGVVESVVRVYHGAGYSTLRFNFRGTGNSEGDYEHGEREQEDVKGALRYLSDQGFSVIDLVGYSFGAWVNALAEPPADACRRMIMVSPPVAFTDFSSVGALPRLGLVVTGGEDEIAPAEEVQNALPVWNSSARFEVIPGTDHFYSGALDRLEAVLDARLPTVEPVPI